MWPRIDLILWETKELQDKLALSLSNFEIEEFDDIDRMSELVMSLYIVQESHPIYLHMYFWIYPFCRICP